MTSEPRILERAPNPRRRRSRPGLHAWAWLAPIVAAVCVRYRPNSVAHVISAILAVALVIVVARHPAGGLLFLVPLLVFQQIVLATMYRLGVPAFIVRPLGGLKDVVLAGLIVAAVRSVVASHRKFDWLDKLAAIYVLVVTAYLLVPQLLVAGNGLLGTRQTLYVRALSYRVDVFFVLLFLAARHVPIDQRMRRRFVQVLLVTMAVVAVVGVYEFFFSSQWNDFSVHVVRILRYKLDILKGIPVDANDVRAHGMVGHRQVVRVGSVFYEPVSLGFYLVIGLGVGVALMGIRRARPWTSVGTTAIVAALIFTLTRSAVAAGLIAAFVLAGSGLRGAQPARVRLALLLVAGLVLATPVAVGSGLASRASGNDQGSTGGHIQSVNEGIAALGHQPLGFGLGAEPGIGDRFAIPTKLTSHDSYLQVGNELGIPTMIVFIALILALIAALRRASADDDPDLPLAHALFAVGVALAIGGLLQHIWTEFPIAWTFWGAAGLAIGAADRKRERVASEPHQTAPVSPNAFDLAWR